MNLLKELAPYQAEINAHARGFGMTNKVVATKLIDIWDIWKNIPEVSKRIYGSVKNIPPTNKDCNSCCYNAIKDLINWKKEVEKTSYYRLVPEGSKSKKKVDPNPKKLTPKKEGLSKEAKEAHNTQAKKEELSSMKWGELKSYAKEQGIDTYGKKKAEILKELNEK